MKIDANINNSVGKININDVIAEYTNSSSKTITEIVDEFISRKVVKTEVYLNCRGGSVFEANEIVNQLNRLEDVTIIVGAIAAQVATYVLACFKSVAHENSQFMIQSPQISVTGNLKKLKNDIIILENINEDYKNVFSNKMGMSLEEITEIFEAGEYWLTATEAKKIGLIDEILSTEKINNLVESNSNKMEINASLISKNTKQDILQALIFNEHSLKSLNQISSSDRLEVLCNTFDAIDSRQDKDTYFIDIVENEHREIANEWIADLTLKEKSDFKEFYPAYFEIFSKKPTK
jgi:ATP-dependent protease ClpP protease subunit